MSIRTPIPIGRELEDILKLAHDAGIAVLLEGDTGIGKSELIEGLARRFRIKHVVLDLSLLEPTDLLGIPYIENGVTRYAPPGILPRNGVGLLVLEELNRAITEVATGQVVRWVTGLGSGEYVTGVQRGGEGESAQ